jgi:hypothetical protein
MADSNSDSDDDEPLTLGGDAMAALQLALGGAGGGDNSLEALLAARRMGHDDSSLSDEEEDDDNDDDDGTGMQPGESHAEYFKRLYPERYNSTDGTNGGTSTEITIIDHPVAIVSMDDEYVQNLILKSFATKKPHWKVVTKVPRKAGEDEDEDGNKQQQQLRAENDENYHFHWGEYEDMDWFGSLFMSEQVLVSCYYNRKGLIRKGNLAHTLEKWHVKKRGQRARIAPHSYVLTLPSLAHSGTHKNNDHNEESKEPPSSKFISVFEHALDQSGHPGFSDTSKETWIVKPSVTNQAQGIRLVQSHDQLVQVIHDADLVQQAGDFVLQEYIPPLLLDGRKFHLRVFVVLQGNLTAYVLPEFLAIFSLEPYDANNIANTRAHLTNIAHQEVLSLDDQHKCMRRFSETKQDMVDSGVAATLEEAGERITQVQTRVYEIVAETIEAVSSELTFTSKTNCFEIFGFDFMIDPSWNTWLLEANAEPDLSKAGDRLQPIIDQLLLETLDLVVGQDQRFANSKDETTSTETSFVKVYERTGRGY